MPSYMAVRKSNFAPLSSTLFLAIAMLIALASAVVVEKSAAGAALRGSKITFPDPCFDACNHENYCTCRTIADDREICCRVCRRQCNQNFDGCKDLPVGPPCP